MRDKPAVCAKFQMSGLIAIAAVGAMSTKCQMRSLADCIIALRFDASPVRQKTTCDDVQTSKGRS